MRQPKKNWIRLFILTLLLFSLSGWGTTVVLADDSEPGITVKVEDGELLVEGQTSSSDPEWVPLLISDKKGQAFYFQDVPGDGRTFSIRIGIPDWISEGEGKVTLYSQPPVTEKFKVVPPGSPDGSHIQVTIRVHAGAKGTFVPKREMSIAGGSSVYDLLEKAADEEDLDVEVDDPENDGRDVYIKSINGLAEFDEGPGSGWVYRVNKKGPPVSVDRYELKEGDNVEILYTTDMGGSEGVGSSGTSGITYEEVDSDLISTAMARLSTASGSDRILEIAKQLLFDLGEKSIEEQKTLVEDVGVFFQAAYDRAGVYPQEDESDAEDRDKDEVITSRELGVQDARELLAAKQKTLEGLRELVAYSNLYKESVPQADSKILVPYETAEEHPSWQFILTRDAWKHVLQAQARIVVIRGKFKDEITPVAQEKSPGYPIRFQYTAYPKQEQEKQFVEWKEKQKEAFFPLTPGYAVAIDQPGFVQHKLVLPLQTSLYEHTVPLLYIKEKQDGIWIRHNTPIIPGKATLEVQGEWTGDLVIVTAPHEFEDVNQAPENMSWVKEPVAVLMAKEVVKGKSSTSFGLEEYVTRAEFVTMLDRLIPVGLGRFGTEQNSHSFSDVLVDSWYAPSVLKAEANGWVLGKASGTFAPGASITRAELAAILSRVASSSLGLAPARKGTLFADDGEIPAWAKSSVTFVSAQGWLLGRSDGRFDPYALLTRAEAVAALYRFSQALPLTKE